MFVFSLFFFFPLFFTCVCVFFFIFLFVKVYIRASQSNARVGRSRHQSVRVCKVNLATLKVATKGTVRYCSSRPRELCCCSAGLFSSMTEFVQTQATIGRRTSEFSTKNTLRVDVSAARVQAVLNSIKTRMSNRVQLKIKNEQCK